MISGGTRINHCSQTPWCLWPFSSCRACVERTEQKCWMTSSRAFAVCVFVKRDGARFSSPPGGVCHAPPSDRPPIDIFRSARVRLCVVASWRVFVVVVPCPIELSRHIFVVVSVPRGFVSAVPYNGQRRRRGAAHEPRYAYGMRVTLKIQHSQVRGKK